MAFEDIFFIADEFTVSGVFVNVEELSTAVLLSSYVTFEEVFFTDSNVLAVDRFLTFLSVDDGFLLLDTTDSLAPSPSIIGISFINIIFGILGILLVAVPPS